MAMDRRSFFQLAAFAGLTVAAPPALAMPRSHRRKLAKAAPYDGPLYIFIHATGGWDPVVLCDPKGATSLDDPGRLSNYLEADIGSAGNHRFAPTGGNQAFFEKHYSKLFVVNGIDTQTNGHDSGSRNIFSGRLEEGYPSLAALIAGANDPAKPMSFLSFGGYDETAGLVARTRAGNVSALARLAFPGRRDPADAESGYHAAHTVDAIAKARSERDARMQDAATLPRVQAAMNTLFTARSGSNELALLQQYLPESLDNSNNPLKRQAQLAIAAYRAGICISANLSIGGFDTHGNHDQNHIPRMTMVVEGLDFILEEATRQGVGDKVVVVVGSDFGRTPRFNDQNGKDHWAITSMMMMGPGIPGNRVVGLTDAGHVPVELDPTTLQAGSGIRIEPAHIHRALRKFAGLGSDIDATFPLDAIDIPLLG